MVFFRLWDVRNQNSCMKIYRGHISHVNSVKFSPDGLWIASAGTEGSVIIWDIRKSKQIMEFCDRSGSQPIIEIAAAVPTNKHSPFSLKLLLVVNICFAILFYQINLT